MIFFMIAENWFTMQIKYMSSFWMIATSILKVFIYKLAT